MGDLTVLGVRHHGPGSARAVLDVLDRLSPATVVIEGAVELERVAALAGDPAMQPPVAAFVYGAEQPERALFYPMAAFSPEWVALRWALGHGRTVRFADLPAANSLAGEGLAERGQRDPLASIARAAGYDDAERWWEDAIEHRPYVRGRPGEAQDGSAIFSAVMELMDEVRLSTLPEPSDLVREAAMRRALRPVVAGTDGPVVMVCGAWHAPVLQRGRWPAAAADSALLARLPKVKVEATWVPWTVGRLSQWSGYGAGVASPGWYEHLFSASDQPVEGWLVRTARLLRDEEMATSTAAVIDAVRLAEALAALRGRPLPGLGELWEAAQAVMCQGSPVPMKLVSERLVVGERLGRVPASAPMVPLARDLALHQARLRLRPSPAPTRVDLDLRTARHLERSALFHRLDILGVGWAAPADVGRTTGTFRESWSLQWRPELEVALVLASASGTTIEAASVATLARRAADAGMEELCRLAEQALLADLPEALGQVMTALADKSALAHDVYPLMASVEPLARAARYGTVRSLGTARLMTVLEGIVTRVSVGLPPACTGLDDEGAAVLAGLVDSVHRGVAVCDDAGLRQTWTASLARLATMAGAHGLLVGRADRALLDAGAISPDEAQRRLSLALSVGAEPVQGAAFLEGFLAGEALLLVHDPQLLGVVDDWVAHVRPQTFDDLLPLLRRAFSPFAPAERRAIGERLAAPAGVAAGAGAGPAGPAGAGGDGLDAGRAALVRPVVLRLLGLAHQGEGTSVGEAVADGPTA